MPESEHPVHPGKVLFEEFMKPLDLNAVTLARDLEVPKGVLTDLLGGRSAISAEMAIRLSAYFGNSPWFWLDMQNSYDLDMAARSGKERRIRAAIQPCSRLGYLSSED